MAIEMLEPVLMVSVVSTPWENPTKRLCFTPDMALSVRLGAISAIQGGRLPISLTKIMTGGG